MSSLEIKPTKRKNRSKKNKISFDEIVIKPSTKTINNMCSEEVNLKGQVKVDTKLSNTEEIKQNKKLKQKREKIQNPENTEQNLNLPKVDTDLDSSNTKSEKTESKRTMKRKKHQILLTEKRLKVDLEMQQKCLNYLSKWKHSRNDWKFEKLRQIWLQQNMFNIDKVPDKFWNVLVKYFSNAKGKIRTTILHNALKIVEENENITDENNDDKKFLRAKDIVQNLQD